MLLRLIPLVCMLAAAAAQQTYYCNSFTGTIRDSDFFIVTLNRNENSYPPGLTCDFNAESNAAAFLVEIQTFYSSKAVLTITSMGSTLFRGYQPAESFQRAIVTASSKLQVRFNATGDYSYSGGVRLRVRAFDRNGCPPDWQLLYGNCYGTSNNTGPLSYVNAQKACNTMRSNLLHLPENYAGSLTSFRNMLYPNLKNYYAWIGLTDRSNRFRHTWLDSSRQSSTYEISCISGGGFSTCNSDERCGAFYNKGGVYAIYMGNCGNAYSYVCSMPSGGTGYFYSVPYLTDSGIVKPPTTSYTYVSSSVVWGVIAACVVIGFIVFGAIYRGVRLRHLRRGAGVVVAGRITTPRNVQVNVQQSAAVYYPPPPAVYYPPPPAVPPPPAYNVAMGGGYPGNANLGYSR